LESAKLQKIISRNKDTTYGRAHSFAEIKTIADFQKHVPLTFYENYIPYIEKIKSKEANVLTSEPVLLLEPTSGSASAKKLIPYTRGLQREFSTALYAWLWNLNKNFPRLKYGQLYFSITPQGITSDGIEGFNSDDEYIGGPLGKFVAKKFCVPQSVKNIQDMDVFWHVTIDYIKKAKNLRFVSIWNPTFMLIMLEQAGMLGKDLFPHLEVISCWADGNSAPYAAQLQKIFPDAYIQPKGLLATEGIMTIPIEGLGKRLTNSHFFEFIDKNDDVRLKDQLDTGDEYEIVLTTSGGLYRYRIGDIVRYNGNMCFDFVGKAGNVSDYFGEKLNEMHVRKILANDGFALLVPGDDKYILYTETPTDADAIDAALRENFHYDYCRKLGQLKKVDVTVIKNGAQQYIENCIKFGMRLGDIKPTYLSNKRGWVFK